MLNDKMHELEIELEDSNTDKEKEIIVNQIDTLNCVLNHLLNLKYCENVRAIKIVEANDNLQQVKQQIKIQLGLFQSQLPIAAAFFT
jgi:hypothetical protein